jgi:hypothetical protein
LFFISVLFNCLVYPALDGSDDEDLIFKPRGKRKMDEAWNPKARVGPLVPKTDRPTREGTKKQAVEKGLEAAAAKRAGLPVCSIWGPAKYTGLPVCSVWGPASSVCRLLCVFVLVNKWVVK